MSSATRSSRVEVPGAATARDVAGEWLSDPLPTPEKHSRRWTCIEVHYIILRFRSTPDAFDDTFTIAALLQLLIGFLGSHTSRELTF